ncbi:N-acetylmuramoyl-L-alanine amidase [Pantanalinema rosaneae CENA516]|uniref:N-acetylmuramoyl-L-alanine amidase n=1 Tax=Pantanalinema rosaneae TaxID=1620701 RepID=UPI003D702263
MGSPALAGGLETWRFDDRQNRLEFTTDDGVQPKAQLVGNPTRLVIDLPGITWGRPQLNQAVSGNFRSMRIAQFDRYTTRIVVELAPGYTLDPQQVKFRGITARQWSVQLPTPQPLAAGTPSVPSASAATPSVSIVSTPPAASSGSSSSQAPSVNSRPWQSPSQRPEPTASAATGLTTIEAIELAGNGSQLVIRGNQSLNYDANWDRASAAYRITLNSAQLSPNIRRPQLSPGSSILNLQVRQENPRTVSLLVQPAAGVQINGVSQLNQQSVALQLQRNRQPVLTPPGNVGSIPVPQAPRTTTPPAINPIPGQLPRVPSGRLVVVIDPGHGGPDPGAVGIGGLQEKGIVLDIGIKVASLLQQQGVQAVLTRQDDRDLDLEPRVRLAEQVNATAFVSIHANAISMSRPDVNGLETYYFQSGAELAQAIHQNVLAATGIPDRRVRTARFYVLRRTSMPSVLVEVGFVTGRDDAARLSDPAYRSQMAEAIVRGILQYLQRSARS